MYHVKAAVKTTGVRVAQLEQYVPIVLDLVEDTVRNRGFTLALYALVLIFIARSTIFIFFLNNSLPPPALLTVPVLSRWQLPIQLEIGSALHPTFTLSVLDSAGAVLPSVEVRLSFVLEDADNLILTRKHRFNGTAIDESGLLTGGVFGVPGFPPKLLQTPALFGYNATSDDGGSATFRNFRVLSGLPASYLVIAEAAGMQPVTLGHIRLTSAVASVELESTTVPLRIKLDGVTARKIPPFSIVVRDANGFPLVGKVAVLFSAPPEASEFSSLLGSDTLHPRVAMLTGTQSTPSNFDGRAFFNNVMLAGSSIRRVRLWVSVDGVVARLTGSASTALLLQVDDPVFFDSNGLLIPAAERGYVMVLQQVPSARVLEGAVLAQQPTVRLQLRGGEPAVGVIVFAFPLAQPDFRNIRVPMSPSNVAEMSFIMGTTDAVLGNLGQVKSLFGAASAPSDADGLASWSGLGFIQHGPAGNYSLGFAAAGMSMLESPTIVVESSVASVVWRNGDTDEDGALRREACFTEWDFYTGTTHSRDVQCDLAATVCNWPTCVSSYGASVGYVQYSEEKFEEILRQDGSNLITSRIRSGPSGALSTSSVLLVRDASGFPLAGKSAVPTLEPLDGSSGASLVELPYSGAGISKLSIPAYITASSSAAAAKQRQSSSQANISSSTVVGIKPSQNIEGAITFLRTNLPFSNDARTAYATEVNDALSFFRVVSAPSGETKYSLRFDVENVRTKENLVLRVNNLDALSKSATLPTFVPPAQELCAHIRIVSSPVSLLQDGSTIPIINDWSQSPLPFLSAEGVPAPFIVQAVNSFGEPVPNVSISMFAVDALGYTMYSTVGSPIPSHLALSSDYVTLLYRNGGVMTHTFGNRTVSFMGGPWLHGPAAVGFTDKMGFSSFPDVTLRRAQNTWMKFGFVAHYREITGEFYSNPSDFADYFDAPAACVSEYTTAVIINSTVPFHGINWANAGGDAINVKNTIFNAIDDGGAFFPTLDELPALLVSGPPGNTPPALLYGLVDEELIECACV